MAGERAGLCGLLVLDKPAGMTSREAVNRAQGWLPRGTRVGHTGTLDPLATGVLVLTLGAATRLSDRVQGMAKTYRAGIVLGGVSDSDDADGTVTPVAGAADPGRVKVEEALAGFVGEIEQVPPAYSAAHVGGRRAHELARRGREVQLAARTVRVYGIEVLGYSWPELDVEVRCGKGTYIRSLARDLGQRLGCGGYIGRLRRTRVGPFAVEGAVTLGADAAAARAAVLPAMAAVPELVRLTPEAAVLGRLRHGNAVALEAVAEATGLAVGQEAAVLAADGSLALVARVEEGRRLQPVLVLA